MKIAGRMLIVLLWTTLAASGQENPVSWSAICLPGTVHPGQAFQAQVSARIGPGWHIYSITQAPGGPTPTSIAVPDKQPFALGGFVIGPLPHSSYDPNFQLQTETYNQEAVFKVPLLAAKTLRVGPTSVGMDVRFQACNDRICLPARTVHLNARVTVERARQVTHK